MGMEPRFSHPARTAITKTSIANASRAQTRAAPETRPHSVRTEATRTARIAPARAPVTEASRGGFNRIDRRRNYLARRRANARIVVESHQRVHLGAARPDDGRPGCHRCAVLWVCTDDVR